MLSKRIKQSLLIRVLSIVLVLTTITVGVAAFSHSSAPQPHSIQTVPVSLASNQHDQVTVDCFLPTDYQAGAKLPSVLILHGVEGTSFYKGHHYRNAQALADQGFAVFFLHYFDPFDYDNLLYRTLMGGVDTQKIEEHLYGQKRSDRSRWCQIIRDSLTWMEQQEAVDSSRIALLGYSLGGFLSLEIAHEQSTSESACCPEVKALVINFASRFRDMEIQSALPAVQVHHGVDDSVIDISYARQTVNELKAKGTSAVDFHEYPNQPHVVQSTLLTQRTISFLKRYL